MSLPLSLPVTSFIALPLALLMIGMAYRIVKLRRSKKIGVGVGSSKTLAKAIGAHGNAVENIPLTLILFGMAELQGANTLLLAVFGVLFVIGRYLNAWGVSKHAGLSFGRYYGTVLTWFTIGVMSVTNIWLNIS